MQNFEYISILKDEMKDLKMRLNTQQKLTFENKQLREDGIKQKLML